jgi:DNA polymerase III delta subunit
MITLIHGEDVAKSRAYFFSLKEKESGFVLLDGDLFVLSDLVQVIEGTSLFGDVKTIFIEDFFAKRKQSKEVATIVDYINAHKDAPFVFYEAKELTLKQTNTFKGATLRVFKIPATVFSFLDSIKPGNAKQSIELLYQTLIDQEEQFVIFMLSRHVRILLSLLDLGGETISENVRIAPWQKGKMQSQAVLLGESCLLLLHRELYQLDLMQKTGGLAGSLQNKLDELLITYFI